MLSRFSKKVFFTMISSLTVATRVFCVFACVYVCVPACLFSFTVKVSLLTEENNKCNARDQVSDGMLRKYFCVKYLRRHVIDNHSRNVQASNCAKECQLNGTEPRTVKGNSYKLPKTNNTSAKRSYLSPH